MKLRDGKIEENFSKWRLVVECKKFNEFNELMEKKNLQCR